MNRQERRKAFALGQAVARGEAPLQHDYVRCIEMMQGALTAWRAQNPGASPHFRFPPKEIGLAASIDHVPAICGNPSARELVDLFCTITSTLGPNIVPTVLQLDLVLQEAGIVIERVGLGELGFDVTRGTYTPGEKEPPS